MAEITPEIDALVKMLLHKERVKGAELAIEEAMSNCSYDSPSYWNMKSLKAEDIVSRWEKTETN